MKASSKERCVVRIILPCMQCILLFLSSCTVQQEPKHLHEIQSLKGKTMQDVVLLLGSPRVVDSSASATERIWGYYQVMVRSDANVSPRQRTVLIVFSRHDTSFVVEEVRIP